MIEANFCKHSLSNTSLASVKMPFRYETEQVNFLLSS